MTSLSPVCCCWVFFNNGIGHGLVKYPKLLINFSKQCFNECIITGAGFITHCHYKSESMSDALSVFSNRNKCEANWSCR